MKIRVQHHEDGGIETISLKGELRVSEGKEDTADYLIG
jgi:hypothetical protein